MKQKFQLSLVVLLLFVSNTYATFIGGRTDFRDESIYFLMTTRFYDGDETNNVQCWARDNPGDPPWRGDFKGLIEKLDYIKALGFTAIWITPVVENASSYDYHGYHAINHSKVDPRYESQGVDFQDVIDAVHDRDMKIILDIVLNHTGNFGEENLCPMFTKVGDLSHPDCMQLHPDNRLPANYKELSAEDQFKARMALMKNTDGVNHDHLNCYHHRGEFNWDDLTTQWGTIADDCVDLNTENPVVYNYLLECYKRFIAMGVDGFRIDTGKHISRLLFNKIFNDAFHQAAKEAGKTDFFMFAEIATRIHEVWNGGLPPVSNPFYTWKDSKTYDWSEDAKPYAEIAVFAENFDEAAQNFVNQKACIDNYNDNLSVTEQPTSDNHLLRGNDYHTPDYSMHSGLNVIDFPVHWNFSTADKALDMALQHDHFYNDATFNVVYVDSHDFAPDQAPQELRFNLPQATWAENLSLMFTFRGVPCLYYGSEVEFKKGMPIDVGPAIPLEETGRAYFGEHIEGQVEVQDFAQYKKASGNMATSLRHPLAMHIQRLNQIRMAVPALRKGQYSTENIAAKGIAAFKRRYVDEATDSYALVTISGNAVFNDIENGVYTDVVTGKTKRVKNNSLKVKCKGKGNLRVYVLSTAKTPAPGKVGKTGRYIYWVCPAKVNW